MSVERFQELEAFVLAQADPSPARPAQINAIEQQLDKALEGAETEASGDAYANWSLPNGIKVSVHSDNVGGHNYGGDQNYEILFVRQLDAHLPPEQRSQTVNLSYSLKFEPSGRLAYGYRVAEMIDYDLYDTDIFGDDESDDEDYLDILAEEETPGVADVNPADFAMLRRALLTARNGQAIDPFEDLGVGRLEDESGIELEASQSLFRQLSRLVLQGFVETTQIRTATIDPTYLTLKLSRDASPQGPLTDLAQLRDFNQWRISALFGDPTIDSSFEVVNLFKNFGGIAPETSRRYQPNNDVDSMNHRVLRECQDGNIELAHGQELARRLGLQTLTAAEAEWFLDLMKRI
jgi:hypothetical protein